MPAIIGIFWGAPLITREIEAGTFRLAWNQSITRGRWLAVKLGFIGLTAMATAGLLSLMITWWARRIMPVDRPLGPFHLPAGLGVPGDAEAAETLAERVACLLDVGLGPAVGVAALSAVRLTPWSS
ncbi:MAG: hypothetical protein ACLQDY_23950 [Streptosporangiaceae bacterium]